MFSSFVGSRKGSAHQVVAAANASLRVGISLMTMSVIRVLCLSRGIHNVDSNVVRVVV